MNDLFSEAEQEHFEERAAIVEYDGGTLREAAEAAAAQEVLWARECFRCMVRQLLKWKTNGEDGKIKAWLAKQKNSKRWMDACIAQWDFGNRGVHGDWME